MQETIIILDNIRSALNVGAILRTCDGAGIKKVYLCGITPTPTHPKVQKTSLGAENYVKWEHVDSTVDAIKNLQSDGYTVVAVEQTAESVIYSDYAFPPKTAVVFGHEITGVSIPVLDAVDAKVELPMMGQKQSLNIATTAGIMAYHLLTKNV